MQWLKHEKTKKGKRLCKNLIKCIFNRWIFHVGGIYPPQVWWPHLNRGNLPSSVLQHLALGSHGQCPQSLLCLNWVVKIISGSQRISGSQNSYRRLAFIQTEFQQAWCIKVLNGMPTNQYKNSLGRGLAVICNYRFIKFMVIWGKHINILDRSRLQASLLDAINKQRPLALLPFVLSDRVKAWGQANDGKKTKHQKTR